MTQIRALKLAIILWTWMSKNPSEPKSSFHAANQWHHQCPLCSQADSCMSTHCEDCVMFDRWYSHRYSDSGCGDGSIFHAWWILSERAIYDNEFFSLLIVQNLQEVLTKLTEQEEARS